MKMKPYMNKFYSVFYFEFLFIQPITDHPVKNIYR